MFDDLKGKAVLVTGASTGIGAAVARGFGAAGARVAVHYNSSRQAAEAVSADIKEDGGAAVLVRGDLAVSAEAARVVAEAVAALGGLDILVSNAGSMVARVRVEEIDDDVFDRVVDLNARSVVVACRAAVPRLRDNGGGAIINVTSIAARNGGSIGAGLYAAAKGFVSTYTRGLARELASTGIRVNAVSPGVIDTPFQDRFANEQLLAAARSQIPLGRLGTAEECVGAFLYLASAEASGYVTGQIIEVNGGQYMP